jgi:hypothetical protein
MSHLGGSSFVTAVALPTVRCRGRHSRPWKAGLGPADPAGREGPLQGRGRSFPGDRYAISHNIHYAHLDGDDRLRLDTTKPAHLAGFWGFLAAFLFFLCGAGGVFIIRRSTESVLGENRCGRRSGLLIGCPHGCQASLRAGLSLSHDFPKRSALNGAISLVIEGIVELRYGRESVALHGDIGPDGVAHVWPHGPPVTFAV